MLFTKFCLIINFQNEKVNSYRGLNIHFDPQAPVAPKITDAVIFRRFQGEGVELFKSDLTDPSQIFDAHILENTDSDPSRFHFSVGFISRSCFESDVLIAYSNE